MKFEDALKAMRKAKVVARAGATDGAKFALQLRGNTKTLHIKWGSGDWYDMTVGGTHFSNTSILAEDWEVAE